MTQMQRNVSRLTRQQVLEGDIWVPRWEAAAAATTAVTIIRAAAGTGLALLRRAAAAAAHALRKDDWVRQAPQQDALLPEELLLDHAQVQRQRLVVAHQQEGAALGDLAEAQAAGEQAGGRSGSGAVREMQQLLSGLACRASAAIFHKQCTEPTHQRVPSGAVEMKTGELRRRPKAVVRSAYRSSSPALGSSMGTATP